MTGLTFLLVIWYRNAMALINRQKQTPLWISG